MRTSGLQNVLDHLRLADGGLTDGQLLTRFLDGRDEAAFAALVRRHGPMVLGVCLRVLGHAHDAEDAFQATFLVLARKASSVTRREAVASFLYGVAYRTALRARARANRRRATERQVETMPHPAVQVPEAQDWRPVLDRELSRLPQKYRAALVLCDLEGRPRREAARQLGLPEGTLGSRLATARRMLAARLVKCGVSLSGGALAVALAEGASAALPARWVHATARAAALLTAGEAAAVATPAALLMQEVIGSMLMTKLKVYVAAALLAMLLGAGGVAYRAAGQAPKPGARPLTDLEVLRREVEILKLQMEVMQAKVHAQEAELRTLRAPVKASPDGKGKALPGLAAKPASDTLPAPGSSAPTSEHLDRGTKLPRDAWIGVMLRDAEDALKALRSAKDDEKRRRAVEVLELLLRDLRRGHPNADAPRDNAPRNEQLQKK
jgi:RNA polymerase sigma factor (sigma-70 family)